MYTAEVIQTIPSAAYVACRCFMLECFDLFGFCAETSSSSFSKRADAPISCQPLVSDHLISACQNMHKIEAHKIFSARSETHVDKSQKQFYVNICGKNAVEQARATDCAPACGLEMRIDKLQEQFKFQERCRVPRSRGTLCASQPCGGQEMFMRELTNKVLEIR